MNKYIALDCETGGVANNTSLLTAYLAVLDEQLNIVEDLYLNCKPSDGVYVVTGKAMEINGIDLKEHDKAALAYKECGGILYTFLKNNYKDSKLIPLGHGVKFDCLRMITHLVSQGTWDNFVSYRVLDTATIALFLIDMRLLPIDLSCSLDSLVKHFKIGEQGKNNHNAKKDTFFSIEVYKKFKSIMSQYDYLPY